LVKYNYSSNKELKRALENDKIYNEYFDKIYYLNYLTLIYP